MQIDIDFFTQNASWIYTMLGIIGSLYAFFSFVRRSKVTKNIINIIKLITEVPNIILQIKNQQSEIFKEIRLQGKFINSILETLELAQFLCDSDGKCIKVNSKWTSLTGLSEEEAAGHHWLLSVHFEDRDRVQKKWYQMTQYNTPFEEVFRYQHRVTEEITNVKCTATDVLDEEGSRIFIIGLSRVV